MKEIQDVLPGFDYERLSQEQKEAVDEVFRVLSEKHSTLDLTPLRIKFKLEEKKYYQGLHLHQISTNKIDLYLYNLLNNTHYHKLEF